jgi:uncharacterized membrane protein (DUF4010 family)
MTLLEQFWGSPAAGFVIALAVGLLIGVERERRKSDPSVGLAGGLRTHVVVALAGALAAQFSGVSVVVAGAIFIGLLVVIAYWRDQSSDRGLTSEVTLFTTYLLGALAPRFPELAGAVGAVIALVLALRTVLHHLASRAMSDREVLDVLLLAASALVILPLMPDRAVDTSGVINPQRIWALTLLVLMMNAVGYLALRTLGPSRGLPVASFFGGFISSTATIGVLGSRAAREPQKTLLSAGSAMASSVATPIQLLVLLAAVDPALFVRWMLPALVMLVVAGVATFVLLRRDGATADHAMEAFKGRAFQPLQAMVFSVTVTAILWCAAWLDRAIGSSGAVTGLVVAGFADAHSAVVGAASLVHSGGLGELAGAVAVLGALGTNTLAKLIVAAATGGRRYVFRLAPGLILMWLAAGVALALSLSSSTGTP